MSGLQVEESGRPAAAAPVAKPLISTERWVAIIVLGSFAFLVGTRHAFREFIPR